MHVHRDQLQSTANCRNTLRAAISAPHQRRNWVQILMLGFCMTGLAFNILTTLTAFTTRLMALPQSKLVFLATGAFLFFWMMAQIILWLTGIGVLGRMLRGRAMTLREGLDDLFLRRA